MELKDLPSENTKMDLRIKLLEQRLDILCQSITSNTFPSNDTDSENQNWNFEHSTSKSTSATDVMRKHLKDFLTNFSLPGVKYVGETGSGRFAWIIVLLASVIISSKYIHVAYRKWEASPVLLTFNDSLTPVSLVPFPAVTFCPSRRIGDEAALREIVDGCINSGKCSDNVTLPLTAASLLCPKSKELQAAGFGETLYNESVAEALEKITIRCEDMIDFFKFNNDEYYMSLGNHENCSIYFQSIYSEGSAVCFTFNMLPAKDMFRPGIVPPLIDETRQKNKLNWSPDTMLRMADLNITVPRYIDSNGRWSGLFIGILNFTANDNDTCGPPMTDAKIYVHNPAELPIFQHHEAVDLHPHKELYLRVLPSIVTASEELEVYSPINRRCHFSHERPLALFKIYTSRNCQLECRANCSLSLCGCVPFYLPRINSSVRICEKENESSCSSLIITGLIEQRFTWKDVLMTFRDKLSDQIQETFRGYETVNDEGKGEKLTEDILERNYPQCSCNCPAACTTLDYGIKVEEGEATPKLLEKEYTRIAVSFKNVEFTSVVRKELIGITDFIANSGGVLGVFTGFSFLAVCELFYYLTLRLWRTIKHGLASDKFSNNTRYR